MAQSVAQLPIGIRAGPTTTRSNSLASTASSNSGASLRRRSRTRTRTLPSGRRGKSIGPSDAERGRDDDEESVLSSREGVPPLPPLDPFGLNGHASLSKHDDSGYGYSPRKPKASSSSQRPPFLVQQPPQELLVQRRERSKSSVHVRDIPPEANRGRQTKSENGSMRGVKATLRGQSLPRHAFRMTASPDSSCLPSPLTPNGPQEDPSVGFNRRMQFRDSVISQQSSTSSSLYPQSTSTSSHAESSIEPRSLKDKDEDLSSFSPRIVTHSDRDSDFDVDDVSYRLRLLVNNSYFLPPAHSKPSPLSLAPPPVPSTQKANKQSAPGFLGFFGLGKSKPKSAPVTPLNLPADPHPPPVLRTTSDSTSASGMIPRPVPQSLPQAPRHVPFTLPHTNPTSRVVVLRERMDDLVAAAKQAEQEIKTKGGGRKSQNTPRPILFDDVIDPTDAVDLPPPSTEYPFAVQASALHGLGIQDSVGAAVLAECLPPSPGMWSMSTEEDSWRKALLQDAVSHSLSSDNSFSSVSSHPVAEPQSPPSFRDSDIERPSDETPTSSTPKAVRIGQRILEPDDQMNVEEFPSKLSPVLSVYPRSPTSSAAALSPGLEAPLSPWTSPDALRRAETPAMTHPLAPPPRRALTNPMFSQSQTDLRNTPRESATSSPSGSSRFLRKAVSSPRLSAMPDADVHLRDSYMMTPPPIPQGISSVPSSARRTNTIPSSSSHHTLPSVTSESRYSDDELSYATPNGEMDDEPTSRPSMSLSIPTDGRPSLSEYSHPSPTASAFQDAVFGSCRTPSPLLRRSHTSSPLDVFSHQPTETPLRSSAISPPPRASSSLGPTILPPPPRSPAVKPIYRPSTSSGASNASGRNSIHSPLAAEPTSPPIPIAERRGHTSGLSLRIPTDNIPPSIHSAPAPASPTAFFDRIQSHPNAMDDLETSDESDEEEGTGAKPFVPHEETRVYIEPRTRAISNSASTAGARSLIMRLGNHSTPQLTPSPTLGEDYPPFNVVDPAAPISNVAPPRPSFFASRKKNMKHGTFLPDIDPDTFSQKSAGSGSAAGYVSAASSNDKSRASSRRRPATADAAPSKEKVRAWQRESLQKFDGMLLQHIAAEKDTIKKITTNISSSSRS
ncbi:hypothetical protein ABKN59_007913 [Abortiporus biennis]